MGITKIIPSSNAGELSPYLASRIDLDKYNSGCKTLENFTIMPYGGVNRRPGLEVMGKPKYDDKRWRAIDFNFSTTTRFTLEFGDLYVRFWSNGFQVPDPSNPSIPYELVTTYSEADLRGLKTLQINDVIYITHPNHFIRKLTRLADDSWTIAIVSWAWPPFLDENTSTTTITPSGHTGSITLTASASIFDANHVGAYFQIGHRRANSSISIGLNTSGAQYFSASTLKVLGKWELTTSQTWSGTLLIQRSKDGSTNWETARTFNGNGDRNVTATGDEATEVYLRLAFTRSAAGSGTPNAYLEVADASQYGVVQITVVTSPTVATATVTMDLLTAADGVATTLWSEGAFSAYQGRPNSLCLHEGRLCFGGTVKRPLSIWGSTVDDFENMRRTSLDDSSLYLTLSSQKSNAIQWICSQDDAMLIGTTGEEWTVSSSDSNSTITPSNVKALRRSSFGSKALQALVVNDVVLFIQRSGRKVRELVFSLEKNGWVAQDLTLLSEHVTKGEVLECAFQQQQDAIFWAVTGNGQLIGLTYERDQNVTGWHRHVTGNGDSFETVATIYGTAGDDEVWVGTKRTINGQTKRFIERLRYDCRATFEAKDKTSWFYLDCATRFNLPAPSTTITGLSYLEGMTVDVLADGAVEQGKVVTGGQIALSSAASTVLVGLPYTSTLQPMTVEVATGDGTSKGKKKRINEVHAQFLNSLGGQYSSDGTNWDAIPFRDTSDPMDSSPPPFTGLKKLPVSGGYSTNADFSIRQTQPLPLTVLSLTPNIDINGS